MQLALTSRVPFVFDAIGVLAAAGAYFFIGRFVHPDFTEGAAGFLGFAAAGLAVLRLQVALVRTVRNLERDQVSGTLELVLAAPVPGSVAAFAATFFEIARGTVLAMLLLLVSRFVFGAGLTLGPRAWAGMLMGVIGGGVCFACLAVIAAAVLVAYRQGAAVANLFVLVAPILSAAYFPLRVIPEPLQTAVSVWPLTLAVQLMRDAVVFATFDAGKALVLAVELVLLIPFAGLLFAAGMSHARRMGTLHHQ